MKLFAYSLLFLLALLVGSLDLYGKSAKTIKAAESAYKNKKYKKSIEILTGMLSEDDDDRDIIRLLALNHYKLKDYKQAKFFMDRLSPIKLMDLWPILGATPISKTRNGKGYYWFKEGQEK